MADVVALLPVKGHSERVPGKNLRPLAGRPLYHWILDTLLSVPSIATVVVDTDSEAIADDAASSFPSVAVRQRPDDLLGDEVPMHHIVARFVAEHPDGEVFLQTHATNPLLTSATIAKAIDAFMGDGDHDSLMSVTEWQTRFYDHRGDPVNHDPEVLLRTQDLDPIYEENSNIYIAPREVISRTGRRVGANPMLFPMERLESIDIDEEIDFVIAECLMHWRESG
jgi:CMP-N-acetylneuraminic acid synthetase